MNEFCASQALHDSGGLQAEAICERCISVPEVQRPISDGLLVCRGEWYLRPPHVPDVNNQMTQTCVLKYMVAIYFLQTHLFDAFGEAPSTQSVGIPVGITPALG